MIDYCNNLTDEEIDYIIHGSSDKIPYFNDYAFFFKRISLNIAESREAINIILNYREELSDIEFLRRVNRELSNYITATFLFGKNLIIPILYILVNKNKTVFDSNYKIAFNIVMNSLKYYPNVNKYMKIRELNDIRDKHIINSVDGKINVGCPFHKNTDVIIFSLYLVSFGYYYDIPRHEIDSMLDYFNSDYDVIIDLCLMNGMTYMKNSINTIDKDYYPFITNYLKNKLDKKIIK